MPPCEFMVPGTGAGEAAVRVLIAVFGKVASSVLHQTMDRY
jgi:hypothetical protein